MYERFTDRARKCLQLANQKAQEWGHEYLGCAHLVLGLIKEGSGVAVNVFKNLNVSLEKLRIDIEGLMKMNPNPGTPGKLPRTSQVKKVIDLAIKEANELGHNYVGTEHLGLGLVLVEDCTPGSILNQYGITAEMYRKELLSLLGDTKVMPPGEAGVPGQISAEEVGYLMNMHQELTWLRGYADAAQNTHLSFHVVKMKAILEAHKRYLTNAESKTVHTWHVTTEISSLDRP